MADEAENKPAEGAAPALEPIVKKKKIDAGHAGAHGGAWKIALADMMTAMMAFFLLMWLLGSTTEGDKKGIQEHEATKGLSGKVHVRKLDVANEADVGAFVDWAHGAMGGLNGLINNAGYAQAGPLELVTEAELRRQFDSVEAS